MNKGVFLVHLLMIAFLIFTHEDVKGQQSVKVSLEEARNFALEHNREIVNAKKSHESADLTVKETYAAYMPHVNLTASLSDNLELMTSILPGEMLGMPGEKIPVQFGQQFNSDFGGTATQVLFNGPLIVGIQTTKIARELAAKNIEVKERDVLKNIEATYYLALTCEESVKILEGNLENLEQLYEQTKVSNAAGLVEDVQVDQLLVQRTTLKDAMLSMQRQTELSYNLLRFQMGLSADSEIELTQTLADLIAGFSLENIINDKLNKDANLDLSMMKMQLSLSEQAVKSEQAAYLPTLSAYYSYSKSGMGDKLGEMDWFPMSVVGMKLSFPVFGSGDRYYAIRKAKIDNEIAINNYELVSDNLGIQEKQVKFNLKNAYEKYLNQEQNREVAGRVLDNTSLKYIQGISSGTEFIQANNDYLTSVSSYVSALSELLNSWTEYKNLFNNMK
jgi:outer membrane protein TolC